MEFNQYRRAIACAVFGLVVAVQVGSALAQSSNKPPNFKYLDLPNGQRQIVPYSDTRQASQGQQVWNQATANTAAGFVEVGRTASLPNPNGAGVPAAVRGRLPAPQVAAAFGRVMAVTVKAIGPIGIGLAVYDLAKELGFTLERKPDGSVAVNKSDPSVCSVSPCYQYATNLTSASGSNYSSGWMVSFQAAADSVASQASIPGYTYAASCSSTTSCIATRSDGYVKTLDMNRLAVEPTPAGAGLPSTMAELQDAVAAKSGWPTSSKINQVVLSDPNEEQQVPVDIVASGSASSPGPKSSTTNTTNNTTSNSTTTYNHVYQGDTISTTVSVVNVTTNNSTGATTTETTTSTPPTEKPSPASCPPGSTELNCASLDVPEDTIPKSTKDITYSEESMFGGGVCPADVTITQATTGRPIRLSYTPTCNALANYVKPVIIAIALFMAYLIILPGRND